MRPLLWLGGQRHRVTARRLARRAFTRNGHLTPRARLELAATAGRRTP